MTELMELFSHWGTQQGTEASGEQEAFTLAGQMRMNNSEHCRIHLPNNI